MDLTTFAWALAAVLLLVVELLIGSVYVLAWSAGAGVGALLQWFSGSFALAALGAALSTFAGSVLAHRVRQRSKRAAMPDPDLGGEAILLRELGPNRWRVQFRGAEWEAEVSGASAAPQARARVRAREGNLLHLDLQ